LAPASRATLLVDGACGVCCWGALQIAARIDGLALSTIQRHLGSELAELGADRALASWHLLRCGQIVSGADVIPALLALAGRRRQAVLACRMLPALRPAYRALAATRAFWSRAVPAERRSAARELLDREDSIRVARSGRLRR
jgi:predicted DCC family thiol-disulfide oxidoreductase YuxK